MIMRDIQYLVFISLIATSGTDNASFLKGVPRLSNNSYWDYYFHCTSTGQTLQWYVNNSALGELSQGIAQVISDITSTFKYIATTLLRKPISENIYERTSLLIVSCQEKCDLIVICTNGSLNNNMTISNVDDVMNVEDKINDTFVFLDYVLTENIFGADNLKKTSIFVCGVANMFMTWQVNRNDFPSLSFTINDNFGQDRRTLQENSTTVKQQGILIGEEPYILVTALIIVDDFEPLTVTCGYNQNEVCLLIKDQLTLSTNSPDETTASSFSGSKSTTTGSTSAVMDVGLIVSVIIISIITIGITLLSMSIIWYTKCRNCSSSEIQPKLKDDEENKEGVISLTQRKNKDDEEFIEIIDTSQMQQERKNDEEKNEIDSSQTQSKSEDNEDNKHSSDTSQIIPKEDETPLNVTIKKKPSKSKKESMNYNAFCRRVEYIISIHGSKAFMATATFITAPDVEESNSKSPMTEVDDKVYAGMIRKYAIGLIKHKTSNNGKEIESKINNAIKTWFTNAKYLISVGCCSVTTCCHHQICLGDVIISDKISLNNPDNLLQVVYHMTEKIKQTFCVNPNDIERFQVSSNREAKYFVGAFAHGSDIIDENTIGYDAQIGHLSYLQAEGILEIIAIRGVTGYFGKEENKDWRLVSCQAAFHYVSRKMCASSYEKPEDLENYPDEQ